MNYAVQMETYEVRRAHKSPPFRRRLFKQTIRAANLVEANELKAKLQTEFGHNDVGRIERSCTVVAIVRVFRGGNLLVPVEDLKDLADQLHQAAEDYLGHRPLEDAEFIDEDFDIPEVNRAV